MPSSTSHPAAPLLRVLQTQLLPTLETSVRSHLVIARAHAKFLALPQNVTTVPLEIRGKRAAVRNAQTFQRAVQIAARWPRDGMQELRIPKIMFVVAGQAAFRAGDYVLRCPAGTFVLVPPGVPHTDGSQSHLETLPPAVQSCSVLWLTPMMSGLACRMCHAEREKHRGPDQGEKVFLHRPQIMQLVTMLVEEVDRDTTNFSPADPSETAVVESLVLTLMRIIARDIEKQQFLLQEVAPGEAGEQPSFDNSIDQAVHYINTHFASTLTLDDVARRFFFSRAQFTRKFREHTGKSFVEYLNARRLEQARHLLTETDWTAVMITRYIGFGSSAYFHRIFLRETGMPPMRFRAQSRSIAECSVRKN